MNQRLTSSPEFTIRAPETTAEFEQFLYLNARTFRAEEDPDLVVSRRRRFSSGDPAFHLGQFRTAFLGKTLVGGYRLQERRLCLGSARLRTGCIGSVMTHPDYRHQGIATALMHDAHAFAQNQHYALLLLHGIPNFYHQFGFADCLENLPTHAIDRAHLMESSRETSTIRPATRDDAPALLTFYQSHYGIYPGNFALSRSLEHQEHLIQHWHEATEHQIVLSQGPTPELQGYLMLSRQHNRLYAYEVAAQTWPAALALLQVHFHLLEAEPEPHPNLAWPVPLDSPTYYLLAEHLPLRSEILTAPDTGWMGRPVHLPTLFQSLLPPFQERWQSSATKWAGTITLQIDGFLCFLEFQPGKVHLVEQPAGPVPTVTLGSQRFTQLLFGYRPIAWLARQAGQAISAELLPILETLFPRSPAWIAGSDAF